MRANFADIEGPFQRFCLVGMGGHARTKLIPALMANGQQIVGIVTSQSRDDLPPAPVFRRLEDALSSLPADTAFVIATPPAAHFEQAMAVLKAERDLIVEKPAFVTEREAVEAVAESRRRGRLLIEAFMHRHTELWRRLMSCWRAERDSVEAINITFLISVMPAGTFRQQALIASSSLYDMGCYILSLLAELELPLDQLELTDVDFAGDCEREALDLAGSLEGVRVTVRIGVDLTYVNCVSLQMKGGKTVTFSPFFYGRSGERIVRRGDGSANTQAIIHDNNAFEKMFSVRRSAWIDDQPERARRMVGVTAALERLANGLRARRNDRLDEAARAASAADLRLAAPTGYGKRRADHAGSGGGP